MRKIPLGFFKTGPFHDCLYNWPEEVFIQGGDNGIVLSKGTLNEALTKPDKALETLEAVAGVTNPKGSYRTAFFEAFPPKTFIRGEGKTIEEAEKKAWDTYQKQLKCSHEKFEKRGYKNGAGFCTGCGQFRSRVFEAEKEK